MLRFLLSFFLVSNTLFALNKSEVHNMDIDMNADMVSVYTDTEESCFFLQTLEDCNSNEECSWCVAGAVKSTCHSIENANRLPSSIFNCNKLNIDEPEMIGFYDDIFDTKDSELIYHPLWSDFLIYTERFNKQYISSEVHFRFYNFVKNVERIENNVFNFEMGLNSFADMNENEFEGFIKGLNTIDEKNKNLKHSICSDFSKFNLTEFGGHELIGGNVIPSEVDWREKGAVTPVKDQGKCGSCWSFSATGSMEGAWAIRTGKLESFSEQQLIDCSIEYGNSGCQGGLMDGGFEYAIDNGMCLENDKPYLARSDTCNRCNKVAYFSQCFDVTSMNELHLKQAVSRGPVSVAIEADTLVFQLYSGGIVDNVKCGTNLDHGVLVVGYGEDNGKKYWIVKNSWGDKWGEDGYVKIARTDNTNSPGMCGIALSASFVVV
jgi:C1A family cysteine protease